MVECLEFFIFWVFGDCVIIFDFSVMSVFVYISLIGLVWGGWVNIGLFVILFFMFCFFKIFVFIVISYFEIEIEIVVEILIVYYFESYFDDRFVFDIEVVYFEIKIVIEIVFFIIEIIFIDVVFNI